MGQWIWAGRLIEVLFDASADVNDYITRQVINSPDTENEGNLPYLRLQPNIKNSMMDDASIQHINRLIDLTKNYIESNREILANFLLQNA